MDRIFGIDLGTTNSVIAYTDPNGTTEVIAGQDGGRIVPSVVYFPEQGEPVVGALAREHAITDPDRVARLFKRGMGGPTFLPDGQPFAVDGHTWAPEALSALVLRKLAQMAGDHYGEPVRRVVITVPAYFGEAERAATRNAGEIAGLEVVKIVDEPTAAAVAHGLDRPGESGMFLVFDLGGGTFDVTVMRVEANGDMQAVAIGGERELGGMDFDELILGKMIAAARESGLDIETEAWARQEAYVRAEEIKKELSFGEIAGRSLTGSGRPLRFELSRGEFESLLANRLREVEDTTLFTLENADLGIADMTKIIMVGGSSRIPAFQRLLARLYRHDPSLTRNLDEDVARGAAMLAAKESGELDPRSRLAQLTTAAALSQGIGMTVTDPDTRDQSNALIVRQNEPIPAAGEGIFVTIDEGQTGIRVHLNEGNDEDLAYVKEIAYGDADFGRTVRKGYPMRVKVTVNDQGLVRFDSWDGETEKHMLPIEVVRPSILSRRQVEQERSHNATYKRIG
jgi:molecular chaperone DnaK